MHDAADVSLSEVRAIEERAFNAWPALSTLLADGWLLRFADGYTKRANSINAWQPGAPVETILAHAAPLYASRGLATIVRVSPLAPPSTDAVLAARGFDRIDETTVMTARLDARAATSPDDSVSLSAAPDVNWCAGFADANAVPSGRRTIHDRILAAIPSPAAFAMISDGTRPIGWGLAAVERGFVGLFDIATSPEARRQGAATRLVGHLLAWASQHGATRAYLQVVSSNAPAIALYQRLGFAPAYRYHYRIAPD